MSMRPVIPLCRLLRFGLLGGLLALAGCGGWRTVHTPKTARGERPGDAELDRRAEAWARFATGVVDDGLAESDRALEEYRRSLEADPSHEALAIDLARRYLRRHQPEEAIAVLQQVVDHGRPSGRVYGWRGWARDAAGETEAARRDFRECVRRLPGRFLGWRGLASLAYQAGDAKAALKVLDRAARQRDVDAAFLVDLADMLALGAREKVLTNDQVKERIKTALDRARRLGVSHPDLLRRMGALYEAGGCLNEAIASYEALQRALASANPALRILIHQRLFQLYRQTGDAKKAAGQLQAMLDLNPTNPQTRLMMAQFAIERKDYAQAAEQLRQLLLLNPEFEPAYYQLAGLELTLGRPREALATLDRARQRFQPGFPLEFYSGLAALALDHYTDAVKYLSRAEILGKVDKPAQLDAFFYFQLGAAHERLKQFDEAVRCLKKSLELDPENAPALNYLGYTWADRGEHLAEARKLIEKAVALEPDNPAYLDSLGWVLFKLGRMEDALVPQLRAVKLQKEPDATLLEHLGDIYSALGRAAEARDAYTRSLAVQANEEVQRKLEGLPR
jgi:tetratricopeptide (TPR) repeat protein